MGRVLRFCAAVVVLVALVGAFSLWHDAQGDAGAASTRSTSDHIKALERKVKRLEGQAHGLRTDIEALQAEFGELQDDRSCTGYEMVTGSDKFACRLARLEDRLG
jgi:hypothetical protein